MAQGFSARLKAWHARHGRHDLPWQREPSSWRVWVSEVMLQQTQVATVIPYFERFIARFPAPRDFATAPLDEAMSYWSGLGYYARARNLYRAARLVVERHGGELPRDIEALTALPGIGRSTAGAILALAHDERHPILDGNVKRVLARHAGIEGWPGQGAVAQTLWAEAEHRTPQRGAAVYTQAIMDLGAGICARRRPTCADCPVATDCVARRTGRQDELPAPRPPRAVPLRRTSWLLIECNGSILLERRPPAGVWGGLWSLPEVVDAAAAREWCRANFDASPARFRRLPVVRHAFTHFRLEAVPLAASIDVHTDRVMEGGGRLWYNTAHAPPGGMPTPVARLLDTLKPQKDSR